MMTSPMPPQPKTVELPAVPTWAVELTQSVREGFARTNANLELVSNDLSLVKERVALLESWKISSETRAARTSDAVRSASQVDVEQAAQLAQERAAREALAAKLDALSGTQEAQLAILSRLDKVAANPIVKTLAAMLATAVITWLASHGIGVSK